MPAKLIALFLAIAFFATNLHAEDFAKPAATEPAVPADVAAAMNALPPQAKPQIMRRARNGAICARLPNGCEIIVMEKHNAPVSAVQAWVRTGAIDEGQWMGAGLSHFCEHMLFKGTNKRPTGKLDQEIRGAGGDDNAYTTSERTVYHITSQSDGFDVSFNALADMVMDSTFPPEETVKEHAVVYKEIERYLDSPDAVLWEAFEQLIYQTHPYRVPVLGYADRFQRVTRDEVFAYYQQRYSPQMCAFIAVGDLDAKTIMPKMAATLGAWVRKSVPPSAIPEEQEQLTPRYMEMSHPLCQVPKLVIGFPAIPQRHPDLYALDILASILGDGRSSRLYQEVKDKQELALEVSAFDNTPLYLGYFGVNATLEADKIDAARAAIWKVLEEARTKKPTDDELARAKRKVQTQRVFAQMTAEGLAGALGADWFVTADLDFSDEYVQKMQEVTADDVLRVANKYFIPEKMNTAVLLPADVAEKRRAGAAEKKEADLGALQNELKQLQADGEVAKASLIPDKAVFEVTLKKSGLRLVVREDHSLPAVNIAVAALGGTRWEPPELAGAGNLLSEMLDRGTATRDKLKMAQESENLGATLSTFSGRNSFGVQISGLKQDAPKLMELAADCMLHPSFPKDELEKLRTDTLQAIAEEDESVETIISKQLRPLVYGSHPYARQTLGTAETVKKVTLDDLKKLHQTWLHPENLAIGFTGDLSALEAVKLSLGYLGDMQPGTSPRPAVVAIPELTGGLSADQQKPGLTGAVLALSFRGVNLKSSDRETLDLIAALFSGLGGRLQVAVRENLGLAYSVGVNNDSQLDGGAITFFVQTDAKSLDKSLEIIWAEAKKLRDEPVPGNELETVKNYLVGTEAIELQNQSDLAQRLALSQLYEEGAANVFARKARLEKVNSEMVKAAALKYLDTEKWAKAILKPK